MEIQFNIEELLAVGKIQNELDYERALIADRRLRILSKDDSKLKEARKQLRDLIEVYEAENWSKDSSISDAQIKESDLAESLVEEERKLNSQFKS